MITSASFFASMVGTSVTMLRVRRNGIAPPPFSRNAPARQETSGRRRITTRRLSRRLLRVPPSVGFSACITSSVREVYMLCSPGQTREHAMKQSTERFLTTHTGSLPRPDDLIRMMFAKEEGVPVDGAALAARVRAAVAEVVRKQVEAGVDIVDDGEMSKPSYATYPKDRLSGFEGASHPLQYRDLVDFPGMAKRVFGDPGRARRSTGRREPHGRLGHRPRPGWLPDRGVAGRDLALLPQRSLSEPRGLSFRHRRRDAHGVRDGGAGGVRPASRLPGPRDGTAYPVRSPRSRRVPQDGPPAHPGARPRARQRPARPDPDAPLLGQLRGAAPLRRSPGRHSRPRLRGASRRHLVRGCQSAPRSRVAGVRAREAAEG